MYKPFFDQDEIDAVSNTLNSGWVAQGPNNKEFESAVKDVVGVNNAICLSNCTAALHLSLLSLGVGPGDEVVVADYTYPATGHSVLFCGAKVRFADVCEHTYNMDCDSAELLINDSTKAIIPVHTFGQMADMSAVIDLAEDKGLSVVEDAACALGSTFKGQPAGSFGDIGCFSFHARKGVTTGEGGMATTGDDALADTVRRLATFGLFHRPSPQNIDVLNIPEFTELGYNYKMSDIAAAIGTSQMKKLKLIIQIKQRLSTVYQKLLNEIDGISPPVVDARCAHVFQSYVAVLDQNVNRNLLIMKLLQRGIQCQIGTYASHLQPVYQSNDKCPISAKLFENTIAIPFYPSMKDSDINEICAIMSEEIVKCKY